MKKTLIMAVAITVGVAFTATAQDWVWTGGSDETNWTAPAAWDGGGGGEYPGETTNQSIGNALQTGTTNVVIDSVIPNAMTTSANYELGTGAPGNVTLTVQAGGDVNFGGANMYFGRNGGTGALVVDGGTFEWSGSQRLSFGESAGAAAATSLSVVNGGQLLISSGAANARLDVWALNPGGNIFTGTLGNGLIQIDTGHAMGLALSHPGVDQNLTFAQANATLRISGDKVDHLINYIATGGIVLGSGLEWENFGPVYDSESGYTELRAIPEPGTMALLGLAGLVLLIRRRRSVK